MAASEHGPGEWERPNTLQEAMDQAAKDKEEDPEQLAEEIRLLQEKWTLDPHKAQQLDKEKIFEEARKKYHNPTLMAELDRRYEESQFQPAPMTQADKIFSSVELADEYAKAFPEWRGHEAHAFKGDYYKDWEVQPEDLTTPEQWDEYLKRECQREADVAKDGPFAFQRPPEEGVP